MFWFICFIIFLIIIGSESNEKRVGKSYKGEANYDCNLEVVRDRLRLEIRKAIKKKQVKRVRSLCSNKRLEVEDFDLLITFASHFGSYEIENALKVSKVFIPPIILESKINPPPFGGSGNTSIKEENSNVNIKNVNRGGLLSNAINLREKAVKLAQVGTLVSGEKMTGFNQNGDSAPIISRVENLRKKVDEPTGTNSLTETRETSEKPNSSVQIKQVNNNALAFKTNHLRERLNKLNGVTTKLTTSNSCTKPSNISPEHVRTTIFKGPMELVVFAKSVKHKQHCVAGKLISNGQWIRPVSNVNGGALSDSQARIQNPHGTFDVKPLQKVVMSLSSHAPLVNQPENYVVDGSTWRQNYRLHESELTNFLDHPTNIWGIGDRVDYSKIQSGEINVGQSLFLIAVTNLRLFVNQYEKRRAAFTYNQHHYDFAVTDPNFKGLVNTRTASNGVICVSLGEPFNGNCFKIVASIF